MTNDSCPWHLFNERDIHSADILHDSIGKASLSVIWFILASSCYPAIKGNMSYLNIVCFLASGWIRRSAAPFLTTFIIDRRNKMQQDMSLCRVFGFLETFMAVHEVECLTHICIERYVMAKYISKGWPMVRRHYIMFRLLSLLFAGAYSLAAALGFGGYGFDFTCTTCTMDMILPDGFKKYIAAAIFVLRSIKPAGFMIIMLIWAKLIESTFADTANNRMQRRITKDAITITAVNLASWAPIACIRGWVVLSQLLYGPGVFSLPQPWIVKLALLWHWSSLFSTALALFSFSPSIREAALKLRVEHIYEAITSIFKDKEE